MCSRQFWGACAHAWAGVAPAVPSEKLAVSWSDTQVHDQGRPCCARAHCTSNRPSATTWRPSTVAGCVQDRIRLAGIAGRRLRRWLAAHISRGLDVGGRFAAGDGGRARGVVGNGGDLEREQGGAGAAVAGRAAATRGLAARIPRLEGRESLDRGRGQRVRAEVGALAAGGGRGCLSHQATPWTVETGSHGAHTEFQERLTGQGVAEHPEIVSRRRFTETKFAIDCLGGRDGSARDRAVASQPDASVRSEVDRDGRAADQARRAIARSGRIAHRRAAVRAQLQRVLGAEPGHHRARLDSNRPFDLVGPLRVASLGATLPTTRVEPPASRDVGDRIAVRVKRATVVGGHLRARLAGGRQQQRLPASAAGIVPPAATARARPARPATRARPARPATAPGTAAGDSTRAATETNGSTAPGHSTDLGAPAGCTRGSPRRSGIRRVVRRAVTAEMAPGRAPVRLGFDWMHRATICIQPQQSRRALTPWCVRGP